MDKVELSLYGEKAHILELLVGALPYGITHPTIMAGGVGWVLFDADWWIFEWLAEIHPPTR
jgi:hypothetical protein